MANVRFLVSVSAYAHSGTVPLAAGGTLSHIHVPCDSRVVALMNELQGVVLDSNVVPGGDLSEATLRAAATTALTAAATGWTVTGAGISIGSIWKNNRWMGVGVGEVAMGFELRCQSNPVLLDLIASGPGWQAGSKLLLVVQTV